MSNAVGLGIFAIGIVLLILGLDASQSMSSEIARLFSEHSGYASAWMIAGGAISVVGGLILTWRTTRKR